MIGLDSNIVLRYLTQDDPVQSPIATELFERRLTEAEPGFISVVVLAETAWVLQRRFRLTAAQIAAAIEVVLQAGAVVVESSQQVFAATVALKEGRASFADALIGGLGKRAGCTCTLTFDRAASRLPDFELVPTASL